MPGRIRSSRATALPLRSRTCVSYRETSSGTETKNDDSGSSRPSHARRPSRKRRRISYNEASSESEEEVECNEKHTRTAAGEDNRVQAPSKRSSRQREKVSTLSQPVSLRKTLPALGASRDRSTNEIKYNRHLQESFSIAQLGGRVPPWQNLPYEILIQIFQYASYPLITETFEPTASISWLVQSALLCKGFAEPALSALYYAPPLCPRSRVYKLLECLINLTDTSYINYHAKVKYLDLEADEILCFKSGGRKPVELGDLVTMTPQLRGIGLHLLSDLPLRKSSSQCFPRVQRKRLVHQSSLHTALTNQNIRLLEWTWNGNLVTTPPAIGHLERLHQTNMFQSLVTLTFVNSDRFKDTAQFAGSTSVLPNLKNLTMKNLAIEDLQHLKVLPRHLEYFAVINCQFFKSYVLAPFLASHGGNLKELVLDHNNSLDLAFMPRLAASCPKLERLKMDLRFYNSHVSFRDSEPQFRTLLPCGLFPDWPRTLQRIELFHLRKWDRAAATIFFSSLVDSADELPNLRYIDIKASVDESNWRERIKFRNKWTSRMEKVFKRSSAPPDPRLRSIPIFMKHRKDFRDVRMSDTNPITSKAGNDNGSGFSHVEVSANISANISSESDVPLASRRRSTRLQDRSDDQVSTQHTPRPSRRHHRRKRKRSADDDSSTEEDSALEDLDLDDDSQQIPEDDNAKDLLIQGMCDVVRVAIDNLRPTEEHLNESNFLDEEISGDEDWNGDDDI
ncbi:MAG: hypothetical protein Q9209_001282 [Squamulea sp. 1 TL-2023]